ncbi:MAG: hypothetical protein K1X89_08455 [Myxococcaceae bacterium]|nr:hypothetical protein [Myxococcaceae bacterium]
MNSRHLAALLFAITASGCAAVQVKDLDQSKAGLAKPAGCTIEPFIKKWPEQKYEVFGTLEFKRKVKATYQGASEQDSRTVVLKELSDRACELGADALHIDDPDYDDIGQSRSIFAGERVITAELIVYRKE